jgi:hypothetical protein
MSKIRLGIYNRRIRERLINELEWTYKQASEWIWANKEYLKIIREKGQRADSLKLLSLLRNDNDPFSI